MMKAVSTGALLVFLCLTGVPQVSSGPVHPGGLLEGIARAYPTPERLALFLRGNLTFQEDVRLFRQPDYWQDSEEFLRRGRGDCEDYALLARDLLRLQGFEAFVLSLYGEAGYAHTVCVYVEKGRYNAVNQDRLIRAEAGSIPELAGNLYPRWKWCAIAERQVHRGRAVRVIRRRSRPAEFSTR